MNNLQTNLARFLDLLGLAGVLDVLEVHLRILSWIGPHGWIGPQSPGSDLSLDRT